MPDEDTFLDSRFAAYRNELIADVTPIGTHAVRATVRHRRRVAVTAGTAAALVLVAGPAAGYAAFHRDAAPPAPATTVTPGPDPTPSPSASPRPSSVALPQSSAPDGRIEWEDLLKAKLDLPPWPKQAPPSCTTRGARLVEDRTSSGKPALKARVYGDADGDGAEETIAILSCQPGEASMQQLVVFDRDTSGRIVTLAQVIRTGSGFQQILDAEVQEPGQVRVQVADVQPCCGTPDEVVQKQWRVYGWDGDSFAQTGGSTVFGVNPLMSDLRLTASELVFTKDPDRTLWRGTLTIKIHNAGPGEADNVLLDVDFEPISVDRAGGDWSACQYFTSSGFTRLCTLRPLPAGETRTLVLNVTHRHTTAQAGTATVRVTQRLPDLKGSDNEATFAYR